MCAVMKKIIKCLITSEGKKGANSIPVILTHTVAGERFLSIESLSVWLCILLHDAVQALKCSFVSEMLLLRGSVRH